MKDYIIKDDLLHYLKDNKDSTISEYAAYSKIDINIIASHIDNLIDLGYVNYHNIANKTTFQSEKSFWINHRGLFFLAQGGFTSTKKAETRKQRLAIAKEFMTYISTFAIIITSWLNYVATDKANDNKIEAEKYENRITQLEKQNDSLIRITNDTTNRH